MNRFEKLHPAVLLLFFAVSVIVPLAFGHPLIAAVSLVSALLYTLADMPRRFVKTLLSSLAVTAAVGLFNFLFAHYGADVLFTFGNTEFTAEALLFGLHQGCVAAAVLVWLTAAGRCLDSEKWLYLLRFAPQTALLFSMVLGFIPRFLRKTGDIREARLALRGGTQPQGVKQKLRDAGDAFSALMTYSLESSMLTANSMTARGYRSGAIRAGRFRYTTEDGVLLCLITLLSVFVTVQKLFGNLTFIFEPTPSFGRLSLPALAAFAVLQSIPAALILWENLQWKLSTVKQ